MPAGPCIQWTEMRQPKAHVDVTTAITEFQLGLVEEVSFHR